MIFCVVGELKWRVTVVKTIDLAECQAASERRRLSEEDFVV